MSNTTDTTRRGGTDLNDEIHSICVAHNCESEVRVPKWCWRALGNVCSRFLDPVAHRAEGICPILVNHRQIRCLDDVNLQNRAESSGQLILQRGHVRLQGLEFIAQFSASVGRFVVVVHVAVSSVAECLQPLLVFYDVFGTESQGLL